MPCMNAGYRFDSELFAARFHVPFFEIHGDLLAVGNFVCIRADNREHPDINRVPEEDPCK